MQTIKISITIICLVLFINAPLKADKIRCRKFSGNYKEYTLTLIFTGKGKMVLSVDSSKGRGFYSSPGNYSAGDSKIEFFYRGFKRTMFIEKNRIRASLHSFNLGKDYTNSIILKEDTKYSSVCR